MNYLKRAILYPMRRARRLARFALSLPGIKKIVSFSKEVRPVPPQVKHMEHLMFQDIPEGGARWDMQFFERLYKHSGSLRSTANFSPAALINAEVYFHHREKSEVALTAGSSWYGGDYFEFGSHDLATFRSMLSAYHICAMTKNYPDVRFYGFDIFGDPTVNAPKNNAVDTGENLTDYFAPYTIRGNKIKQHYQYLDEHNLYRDQCFLVQGLFQNTLTPEFKAKYKSEKRKIGFAFLDCNMQSSYKTVFEFIFDLMAEQSYIYMDEYFQGPYVIEFYQQFVDELRRKRNMGSVYIRNAGGFGGLFRLYPLGIQKEKLELN